MEMQGLQISLHAQLRVSRPSGRPRQCCRPGQKYLALVHKNIWH